MTQPVLGKEVKLPSVQTLKRNHLSLPGSLHGRALSLQSAGEPNSLPAHLLLTMRSLLPLHWPRKCLAKAIHQMFSCGKLPAFHRSFGSQAAASVQGLLAKAVAPFRPITSMWICFSGAFPMPISSFDSLCSLSPFQAFWIVYQCFSPVPGGRCNIEQMENRRI